MSAILSSSPALRKPPSFLRVLAIGLHHASAIAPWLLLGLGMVLSWRAYSITGIWPQFLDLVPPPQDSLYQSLRSGVYPLTLLYQLSLGLFPGGLWMIGYNYPRWLKIALTVIYVTGLLTLWFEPSGRLLWLSD